jgi:hypothetical protein
MATRAMSVYERNGVGYVLFFTREKFDPIHGWRLVSVYLFF